MRSVTPLSALLVLLAFAAGPAFAQTEDEQILQQDPAAKGAESRDEPADSGKQHPKDEELDDEDLDEQVFYSGLGIDRVSTDFPNLGEATNLQAVLGFRIPTVPWVGLEIDLGQTLIPGDYRDPDPGSPGTPTGCGGPPLFNQPCPGTPAEDGAFDPEGDEFAMQALGLSLALKSTGRFYVMGRYGYRYLATSNEALNEDRSSTGFGAGLGYRWGRGLSGVELTYKELAENVESIGVTFYVRSRR
jgi:hypothetical protein